MNSNSLAAAIRHFEKQGELALRCRREHAKEVELETRVSRPVSTNHAPNAEEFAEEAAIAEESLLQQVQRLETLRDTLGASAEQIDLDLAKARAKIEECKVEQRAARKASRRRRPPDRHGGGVRTTPPWRPCVTP